MSDSPFAGSGVRPVVSVAVLTYNHERYIAQALEGVVSQCTPFPIEIVVGEDKSSDGTRRIVERYAEKYPQLVRPLLHPSNLGGRENHRAVMAACRGEFVAILEGDDFWTSPEKLRHQVDWMERHPETVLCFHDADMLDDQTGAIVRRYCEPKPPPRLTVADFLDRNPIPTCSAMFRRQAFGPLPKAVDRLPMLDWPCWLLLAQKGPVDYIDRNMGCYRLHTGGIWSQLTPAKRAANLVAFYRTAAEFLAGSVHARTVSSLLKRELAGLVEVAAAANDWPGARRALVQYMLTSPRLLRFPGPGFRRYLRILACRPSRPMRLASISPV